MNWKAIIITAILAGLAGSLYTHNPVHASTEPVRFQIQPAIADEANSLGEAVPYHEVFMIDTESGKVWQFQPAVYQKNPDGSPKLFLPSSFVPVTVAQAKP
jgi:hypothetical protein